MSAPDDWVQYSTPPAFALSPAVVELVEPRGRGPG